MMAESADNIIEIRPHRGGWQSDEGDGVCPYFGTKEQAISYATQRIAFRRGEIRIFDESGEVEVWKLRDPIERLKAYLVHEGKADHDFFDDLDREADELAAHVRDGCLTMPDPRPESMFDNVYVEDHPLVEAEREQFAAYEASFAGEEVPA